LLRLRNKASIERDNYVLIKSASDTPTTTVAGTIYNINGTIVFTNPIELNHCKIVFYIKKNNIKLPAIKVLVKIGVEEMLG